MEYEAIGGIAPYPVKVGTLKQKKRRSLQNGVSFFIL